MLTEIKERTIGLKKRQEDEKRKEYEKRKNNMPDQIMSKEKLESYQAINVLKEPIHELPNLLV